MDGSAAAPRMGPPAPYHEPAPTLLIPLRSGEVIARRLYAVPDGDTMQVSVVDHEGDARTIRLQVRLRAEALTPALADALQLVAAALSPE